MNELIQKRLGELREAMETKGIDYYLIPTDDFHASEYVNEYFKVREYFSGFTGSAGTLLVWQEGAALWTDGRYFIQAATELEGTGIALMRMNEDGVPTVEEYLKTHMEEGMTLGFDGRVLTSKDGLYFETELAFKHVKLCFEEDLAEQIWRERPPFPAGRIFALPIEVSGESAADKLARIRKKISEEQADSLLLTKLDDIMWTLNIRGEDVKCNPVAMSCLYISLKETRIFLQKKVLDDPMKAYFEKNQIVVSEYDQVMNFLAGRKTEKVLLDLRYCSYLIYRTVCVAGTVVEGQNPTELFKAVKNPTELANMRKIYMRDNVALTKFIYWLKKNIGTKEITEISAADELEQLRRAIPEFLDLSFTTIAGYGSNAAMMHYEATDDSYAVLEPKGFLLVDSGGQYMGGTTDVTRTIALGPLTEEEKYHYSLVAAGMIQMTNARFLYGCTGRNLDILAREPLWEKGLDYKCGTGHGVGYILNVHEGPQACRWQYRSDVSEAVFEEGMDITNEPGIYVEGSHGIRIEDVMVAQKAEKNEYGQFMCFETLTWVPLERKAIEVKYLNDRQREWINAYQNEVYKRISPYLNDEERKWLATETEAV